jgi:hypothetical protein
MLNVAEWPTLKHWLYSMLNFNSKEPPPNLGSPYAWLVAVAIQKIHGIAPAEQKPTLEILRGGKQLQSKWAARNNQADQWTDDQQRELERLEAEDRAANAKGA